MPEVKIPPQKIILSRTDNIGDVILTLPMAYYLKQRYPGVHVTLLGRSYVKAIADCSPLIDSFVDWSALSSQTNKQLIHTLKQQNADAIVHVFPRRDIAKVTKKAGIPIRIATARRWYNWLYCNGLVNFSRKASNQHEAQLNLNLLKPFGINANIALTELTQLNTLQAYAALPVHIENLLDKDKFTLIVHPGSNGNGKEWPPAYYQQLIQSLDTDKFQVLITGTETEKARFENFIQQCPAAIDIMGKLSLSEFITLISRCNALVAASTGPIHLAAALGVKALGLYIMQRGTVGANRWRPIGLSVKVIAGVEHCQQACDNSNCACIRNIKVQQVHKQLTTWQQEETTVCPA